MASGFFALLDDIAAIAKLAAASLDDVGASALKLSGKAAGVVVDDAAVAPRYAAGFAAERELPIVGRIAVGSLVNKIVFILPAALALSAFAPWLVAPILMLGAAYLCFEGVHKAAEWLERDAAHAAQAEAAEPDAAAVERKMVAGAIRTDLILSAEVMAIALAAVADEPLWRQGVLLAAVGLAMTALVYGFVAVIVKADDVGLVLARSRVRVIRLVGRSVVQGIPGFLSALGVIGVLAMLWVGGGIFAHSLSALGAPWPERAIEAAEHASRALPFVGLFAAWSAGVIVSTLFGAGLGVVVSLVLLGAGRVAAGFRG